MLDERASEAPAASRDAARGRRRRAARRPIEAGRTTAKPRQSGDRSTRGRRRTASAKRADAPRREPQDDARRDEHEVTTLERRRRGARRRGRAEAARREDEGEAVEHVGGDAMEEMPRRAAAPAPPIQDPGSHQAPPGAAGAGRQGGARQQGRGADDLSVARRPLFRADAQYRARRRHFAQDHQRPGPQPAEGDRRGARSSRGHGRHPAHRRRLAHQGRGQARFRISAAHVGDGARD